MTDTPNLDLPLIEAAQAQKHVTHNEALGVLDALVQLSVISRSLTAPPSTPAEGDRYIVKATGTGAFAGKNDQIAQYFGGGWLFHPPRTGWLAYVADEGILVAWNGSAWVSAVTSGLTALQNLALLGIGTTADSTNPFSAKLNNALWVGKTVAEGGDGTLLYKLSKESASKNLSLLFQDNYSGRAEIGLTGDDDFHFKVSADGSSWIDAIIIDKTTGSAKFATAEFANAGLKVRDTDASNLLTIKPGSDLTASRTFTLATGDANRTLDISAADVAVTAFIAGLLDDANAATARGTLGLDTMATQAASAVAITSGDVTGVTNTEQSSFPSAPSSGKELNYSDDTGRRWTMRSSGLLVPISRPNAVRRSHTAINNSTTISNIGLAGSTDDGTATSVSIATTNFYTRQPRTSSASAASTGSNCGKRSGSIMLYLNDPGLFSVQFGWESFQSNAAAFVGLRTNSTHGNADPSSFTNVVGIGIDSGQTTWRALTNDGSGTATAVDLGANFPANTSATDWYELTLWWGSAPAKIYYQLVRLNTGDVAKGTFTSDLPVLTTSMLGNAVANTRTGSSAIQIAFAQMIAELG